MSFVRLASQVNLPAKPENSQDLIQLNRSFTSETANDIANGHIEEDSTQIGNQKGGFPPPVSPLGLPPVHRFLAESPTGASALTSPSPVNKFAPSLTNSFPSTPAQRNYSMQRSLTSLTSYPQPPAFETPTFPPLSNVAFLSCLVASLWRRLSTRGVAKPETLLSNPPGVSICTAADFQAKLTSLGIPDAEVSSLSRLLCTDRSQCPLKRLREAVAAAVPDSDRNFASKQQWLPMELNALGYFGDGLASLLSSPGKPISGRLLARWAAQELPGNIYYSTLELLEAGPNWQVMEGRSYSDAAEIAVDLKNACGGRERLTVAEVQAILNRFFAYHSGRVTGSDFTAEIQGMMRRVDSLMQNTLPPSLIRDNQSLVGVLCDAQVEFAKQQLREIDQVLREEDNTGLRTVVEKEAVNGQLDLKLFFEDTVVKRLGFSYTAAEIDVFRDYLDPEGLGFCLVQSILAVISTASYAAQQAVNMAPQAFLSEQPVAPVNEEARTALDAVLARHRLVTPMESLTLNDINLPYIPSDQFRSILVKAGLYAGEHVFSEDGPRLEFEFVSKALAGGGPGRISVDSWRRALGFGYLEVFVLEKIPLRPAAPAGLDLASIPALARWLGVDENVAGELIARLTALDPIFRPKQLSLGRRISDLLELRFRRSGVEQRVKANLDIIFDLFDRDKSGVIDVSELRLLLNCVRYPGPTDDAALAQWGRLDRAGFRAQLYLLMLACSDWRRTDGSLGTDFRDKVASAWKAAGGTRLAARAAFTGSTLTEGGDAITLGEFEDELRRCCLDETAEEPEIRFSRDYITGMIQYCDWLSQQSGYARCHQPTAIVPDINLPSTCLLKVSPYDPLTREIRSVELESIEPTTEDDVIAAACCPPSPVAQRKSNRPPDRRVYAKQSLNGGAAHKRMELERMAQIWLREVSGVLPEPPGMITGRRLRLGFYDPYAKSFLGSVWEVACSDSWKFGDESQVLAVAPREASRARANDLGFRMELVAAVGGQEICIGMVSLTLGEFLSLSGDRELAITGKDGSSLAPPVPLIRQKSLFDSLVKRSTGTPVLNVRVARPPPEILLEGVLLPDSFSVTATDYLSLIVKMRIMLVVNGEKHAATGQFLTTVGSILDSMLERKEYVSELEDMLNKKVLDVSESVALLASQRALVKRSIIIRGQKTAVVHDVDQLEGQGRGRAGKSAKVKEPVLTEEEKNMRWLIKAGIFEQGTYIAPLQLRPRISISDITN